MCAFQMPLTLVFKSEVNIVSTSAPLVTGFSFLLFTFLQTHGKRLQKSNYFINSASSPQRGLQTILKFALPDAVIY